MSEEVAEVLGGGEDEGESRSERDDERRARLIDGPPDDLVACRHDRQLRTTSIGWRRESWMILAEYQQFVNRANLDRNLT